MKNRVGVSRRRLMQKERPALPITAQTECVTDAEDERQKRAERFKKARRIDFNQLLIDNNLPRREFIQTEKASEQVKAHTQNQKRHNSEYGKQNPAERENRPETRTVADRIEPQRLDVKTDAAQKDDEQQKHSGENNPFTVSDAAAPLTFSFRSDVNNFSVKFGIIWVVHNDNHTLTVLPLKDRFLI